MTASRRAARLAAILALILGAALSWAPGASAVTVEASGWWWRPNTTAAPIEVPPRTDVTPDQLLVEGAAEGPVAVAAVRFRLADGETSPILTLTPSSDSVLPEGVVILGCRVASAWVAAQGGKWEKRPIPDCFTSVQGISSGGKITFALTPLQSGPELEVAFYPGQTPNPPNDAAKGSTFTLKFAKPTSSDLKTTKADPGGFTGTGGGFSPPPAESFGASPTAGESEPDPSASESTFDAGSTPTADFSAPSSTSFGPSPAFSQPSTFSAPTAVVPAAPPSGLAANEQAGATGVAPPVQAAPAPNTAVPRGGRTLSIIVLLAGAALAFYAYSGPALGRSGYVPAPVVPVTPPPGAEPVIGGLGRFARPRLGPPPSLS